MICPHCATDLPRKHRHAYRCNKCGKRFALDPKTNPLRLHDLRMRRLAASLSNPMRPQAPELRYTADQLRSAASRRILRDGPGGQTGWSGCAGRIGCFGGVVVVGAAVIGNALALPALGVLILVLALVWAGHLVTLWLRRRRPGLPISAAEFAQLLREWESVYRAPPPGMLRTGPVTDVWPATPPAALLYCTDSGTVAFLVAAGLVERCSVALIAPGTQEPPPALLAATAAHPGLPVLVLHDADPAGCRSPDRLRAALPPGVRVIDVGLRPRVAASSGPPVCAHRDAAALRELRSVLDPAERDWLAGGNTYPLAAVRPARLLRAVELAVGRVDPETQRAAGTGFLDWPEAG